MSTPLINAIAEAIAARQNCIETGNEGWRVKWETRLKKYADYLPSGSGIDSGTEIDLDRSTPDKVVFTTSYHHMVEGCYDGWTEHTITIRPSFISGMDIRISGRDRNQIKDYLHEVFYSELTDYAPDVAE